MASRSAPRERKNHFVFGTRMKITTGDLPKYDENSCCKRDILPRKANLSQQDVPLKKKKKNPSRYNKTDFLVTSRSQIFPTQ